MKHVLVLCLFSAFFVSLAICDCTTQCQTTFQSAIRGVSSQSQACPIMRAYLSCLQSTCRVDLSPYLALLQEMLKSYGFTCNLNSGSMTTSGSIFAVSGGILLAGYRIFRL